MHQPSASHTALRRYALFGIAVGAGVLLLTPLGLRASVRFLALFVLGAIATWLLLPPSDRSNTGSARR